MGVIFFFTKLYCYRSDIAIAVIFALRQVLSEDVGDDASASRKTGVDFCHLLPPSGVNSSVEAEKMSQGDKRGREWVDGMKWKSSR